MICRPCKIFAEWELFGEVHRTGLIGEEVCHGTTKGYTWCDCQCKPRAGTIANQARQGDGDSGVEAMAEDISGLPGGGLLCAGP